MENDVKQRNQRNRRRERAQRMQAQRENKAKDGDSAEDESPAREKPQRPPNRRKKSKEPQFEEDIIDGFAILAFRTYEELENAMKHAGKNNMKMFSAVTLGDEKPPKLLDTGQRTVTTPNHNNNTTTTNHNNNTTSNGPTLNHQPPPPHPPTPTTPAQAGVTLNHDAGTSDDSGRASERLNGASVQLERDSSHDRLSDASSHCSSGKGYICDSEGEDDKGSDAGSDLFTTTRKHELPGNPPPPPPTATLTNGTSSPGAGGHRSRSPTPSPTPTPTPVVDAAATATTTVSAASASIMSALSHPLHIQAHHQPPPVPMQVSPPHPQQQQQQQQQPPQLPPRQQQQQQQPTTPTSLLHQQQQEQEQQQQQQQQAQQALPFHHQQQQQQQPQQQQPQQPPPPRLSSPLFHPPAPVQPHHHQQQQPPPAQQQLPQHQPQQVVHPPVVATSAAAVSSPSVAPSSLPGTVAAAAAPVSTHPAVPVVASTAGACHGPLGMPIPTATAAATRSPSPAGLAVIPGGPNAHAGHPLSLAHAHLHTHPHSLGHGHPHGHPHLHSHGHHHHGLVPAPGLSSIPATVAVPVSSAVAPAPLPVLANGRGPGPSLSPPQPQAALPAVTTGVGALPGPPLLGTLGSSAGAAPVSATVAAPVAPGPGPGPAPVPAHGHPTVPVSAAAAHAAAAAAAAAAYHPPPPSALAGYPGYPLYAPYAASLQHSPYLAPPSPRAIASAAVVAADSRVARSPCSATSKVPHHSIAASLPVTAASAPIATTTTAPAVTTATAVVTTTTTSHRDILTTPVVGRSHSPRGHSPTRERDSYSSNVSSLSRGSITPVSAGAALPSIAITSCSSSPFSSAAQVSSSLAYSKAPAWVSSSGPQLSPAGTVPRPTPPPVPMATAHPLHPPTHGFPPPMFAPPLPPAAASAASLGLPAVTTNPNPFSAESLFQSNQADLLRRELDNRFLASQDRSLNVGPPPYLRTEMHHHQHQHTHVHQHTTAPMLPPPPTGPTLFPPPLFKDIPKLGSVDSPFYRQNLGLTSYPGFSPGLLHPTLGGSTPFAPPSHLPTFTPKQMGDPSKPKPVKTGRWNAMHVRIAWEIYHHQQKQQAEAKAGAGKADLLRPPNHLFPPTRPHDLPPFATTLAATHRTPPFDAGPHPATFLNPPASHLASGVSPFGRYPATFAGPNSAFPGLGASVFPPPRDLPPLGALGPVHEHWSRLQRTTAGFPVSAAAAAAAAAAGPWGLKPEPSMLERRAELEERERERERCRREREREEQREREKQRKLEAERERERERERREKERRELERERLLQQQQQQQQQHQQQQQQQHQHQLQQQQQHAKQAVVRDRSPIRNGTSGAGAAPEEAIRVKEEPRPKEDDVVLLGRTGYHYLTARHAPPGSLRPPHPMAPHFAPGPAPPGWPTDPFRDSAYRFDPVQLRYNPLVAAAFRAEEEEQQRAKLFQSFQQPLQRAKAPSPNNHHLHHRTSLPTMAHKVACPSSPAAPPPHVVDLHKKEESSQSR